LTALSHHRLDGLEPDNLLAFLALLGLLRALEVADQNAPENSRLYPRVAWDIEKPPLRPVLHLSRDAEKNDLIGIAAHGLAILAKDHEFNGRKDLNYSHQEARDLLEREAKVAATSSRSRADLLAALVTDAAVKPAKNKDVIDPTPLCLLFGQGHQHFLDRLKKVPSEPAPPPRGRGKQAVTLTETECLAEALFVSWHRNDPTFSFRWDPDEDVRYALMAGDPTDVAYKSGTQHGANRLASAGLAALSIVPERRGSRVHPAIIGGLSNRGGFSIAWPIWSQPASLSAVYALLGHPNLRVADALAHLSVEYVMVARRISVGKFMNFTRARPASAEGMDFP
jgi:hypothetical protein